MIKYLCFRVYSLQYPFSMLLFLYVAEEVDLVTVVVNVVERLRLY